MEYILAVAPHDDQRNGPGIGQDLIHGNVLENSKFMVARVDLGDSRPTTCDCIRVCIDGYAIIR